MTNKKENERIVEAYGMCNQSKALAILREAFVACNNVFLNRVSEAYLYGSFARGDYHEYSDVDILVTVDMDNEELYRYRSLLASINSELSLKHDVTVSITMKSQEHFRKYATVLPYYVSILKEGVRYGH